MCILVFRIASSPCSAVFFMDCYTHGHMLSVMLRMVFAGILVSASSPPILKITKVLEGMVVVAFRDLPSQP